MLEFHLCEYERVEQLNRKFIYSKLRTKLIFKGDLTLLLVLQLANHSLVKHACSQLRHLMCMLHLKCTSYLCGTMYSERDLDHPQPTRDVQLVETMQLINYHL